MKGSSIPAVGFGGFDYFNTILLQYHYQYHLILPSYQYHQYQYHLALITLIPSLVPSSSIGACEVCKSLNYNVLQKFPAVRYIDYCMKCHFYSLNNLFLIRVCTHHTPASVIQMLAPLKTHQNSNQIATLSF